MRIQLLKKYFVHKPYNILKYNNVSSPAHGFRTSAHQLKLSSESEHLPLPSSTSTSPSGTGGPTSESLKLKPSFNFVSKVRRRLFGGPPGQEEDNMGYFVIGVSGVTCGGKTSLTKLLQRKLPWARVIHQDHYFYDDDWPHHVRSPEAENHVNYEVFQSMDMEKMFEDVQKILDDPPVLLSPSKKISPSGGGQSNGTEIETELLGDKAETPNFVGGDVFLQQIKDIDVDLSKYSKSPILIIEGFTIFGSQFLFDKCHARFFCTLDKNTCLQRRNLRTYIPADSPSYFEKVIWPEYEKHFNEFIDKRSGVTVFDGNIPMEKIWTDSIQIVTCRMEENFEDGKFKDTRENLLI